MDMWSYSFSGVLRPASCSLLLVILVKMFFSFVVTELTLAGSFRIILIRNSVWPVWKLKRKRGCWVWTYMKSWRMTISDQDCVGLTTPRREANERNWREDTLKFTRRTCYRKLERKNFKEEWKATDNLKIIPNVHWQPTKYAFLRNSRSFSERR